MKSEEVSEGKCVKLKRKWKTWRILAMNSFHWVFLVVLRSSNLFISYVNGFLCLG